MNVTKMQVKVHPRARQQPQAALKAFELMEAIKNGALVLSPELTPEQRREVRRELAFIDECVTEYMERHPHYCASVHFDPPSDYMRDDAGGAA